jgi:class 3 adenylate cyclase
MDTSRETNDRDEALLDAARDSVARQAWDEAFELLSKADGRAPLAREELAQLADAAYLSGHPEASLEAWERLHEAGVKEHDPVGAAAAAVRVAHLVRDAGQEALHQAWIRRAEVLLVGLPESAVHGHLAVAHAVGTFVWGDLSAALTASREAVAVGARLADPVISALGMNLEGRVLILLGEVSKGLALLDESALTAFSGTVEPIWASMLFCSTVCALHSLAEYERAEELNQAMERLGHRHAIGVFHGWCRVHSAERERFRGAWEAAEDAATRACEELRPYVRLDAGLPKALLGEIRLRRGDLPGAEEAMLESNDLGWEPQPGYALLRLEQGEVDAAAASIRDAIDHPSQAPSRELPPYNDLRMAPLLVAQVEIGLAAGDVDRAAWAADELERIARLFSTKALQAAAAAARGAVQLAQGDHAVARTQLQLAVHVWQEIGAPYESARARAKLAEAYRATGNEDRAVMEIRSAHHTFERLGARLDAARAARRIGDAVRGSSTARRERRVFMFTDIVKSTDLVRLIGDDAWGHLVRWHNDMLASLVSEHGGDVVRWTGDGSFVTFADAGQALDCAVAIQRELRDHRLKQGFSPWVRIGLHVAEATRESSDWSGVGVHAAARVGALAEAEEILVSRVTADAAGNVYGFSASRVVPLKGLSEPLEVLAVEWR